jgi:hypothetical protein
MDDAFHDVEEEHDATTKEDAIDAYRDELVGDAASSMDFDATITDSLEVHQYTTKNLG